MIVIAVSSTKSIPQNPDEVINRNFGRIPFLYRFIPAILTSFLRVSPQIIPH